jgi:hypothetical protein
VGPQTFDDFRKAMTCFEHAEALRPSGNDDALLRWNSCARMIQAHPDVRPAEDFAEVGANLGE